MYAVQATLRQWPLHQNLELYLVTALQMNWHFTDIAMIMSIYRTEQSRKSPKVTQDLVMLSKKHLQKMKS
jgi:hypothetical protein